MPDEDTSSDTLRDRLPLPLSHGDELLRLAEDAIEYAAQLEAEVEHVREVLQWTVDEYKRIATVATKRRRERDEARADRDRLRRIVERIEAEDEASGLLSHAEEDKFLMNDVREVLAGVERGDTVEKIRRETQKEILARITKESEVRDGGLLLKGVEPLAEGTDQEDD